MILEVMGRNAGWIAIEAGIAGGADVILIPEIPFRLERIASAVAARDAAGSKFSVIVVAVGLSLHFVVHGPLGVPIAGSIPLFLIGTAVYLFLPPRSAFSSGR